MENDEDGRENLMEMYNELCKLDPTMKDVIPKIMRDILAAADHEAAELEKLYLSYLAKHRD